MAASSKRVLQALEEMRDVVGAAKLPRTARRSRVGEEGTGSQPWYELLVVLTGRRRQPHPGSTITVRAYEASTRRPGAFVEIHGAADVLEGRLAFPDSQGSAPYTTAGGRGCGAELA